MLLSPVISVHIGGIATAEETAVLAPASAIVQTFQTSRVGLQVARGKRKRALDRVTAQWYKYQTFLSLSKVAVVGQMGSDGGRLHRCRQRLFGGE